VDVGIEMSGTAAAYPNPEGVEIRLYNATTAAVVSDSTREVACYGPSEKGQITRTVRVSTATNNNTLQLYAKVDTASKADVVAAQTTLHYVKIGA
jgi:hypothetical protein